MTGAFFRSWFGLPTQRTQGVEMATAKAHQKSSVRLRKRKMAATLGVLVSGALGLALPYWVVAKDKDHKKSTDQSAALKGLPPTDLSETEAILHAVNRLGFGPRPGDLERISQMGLARWIDLQLHPESIDDSAIEYSPGAFSDAGDVVGKAAYRIPAPASCGQAGRDDAGRIQKGTAGARDDAAGGRRGGLAAGRRAAS